MTAEEKIELADAQQRLEKRRERLGLELDGSDPQGLIKLGVTAGPLDRVLASLERMRERRGQQAEAAAAWQTGDLAKIRNSQPPELSAEDRERRRRDWLAWCGVPERYLEVTRGTWQPRYDGRRTPWPDRLDAWTGSPWCLVFTGEPGAGKTHAAVAVIQEWAKRGLLSRARGGLPRLVRFVSVPLAIEELRSDYVGEKRQERGGVSLEAWYCNVARAHELVVYDDVGAQPDRDTWVERVNGWLYARHAAARPTIVTANVEDDTIRGVSDRVARRLIGDGEVVTFP